MPEYYHWDFDEYIENGFDFVNIHNDTPLIRYLIYAKPVDIEALNLLLDYGCKKNINQINRDGWTALFYSVDNETTTIEVIKLIIFAGANVLYTNKGDL